VITVTVRGLPAPQGSKRHVGNGRMVEMSKALAPWREAVRAETQRTMDSLDAVPLKGPVRLAVTFVLPRPKSHTGVRGLKPAAAPWPTGRPDLDKCIRAAMDGITAGGAWLDDAQVVELAAAKVYAKADSPIAARRTPGMVAEVGPL
jgi:Holliday junction resolvase RusA-like endonuclease